MHNYESWSQGERGICAGMVADIITLRGLIKAGATRLSN
jgi:hypothetical protein